MADDKQEIQERIQKKFEEIISIYPLDENGATIGITNVSVFVYEYWPDKAAQGGFIRVCCTIHDIMYMKFDFVTAEDPEVFMYETTFGKFGPTEYPVFTDEGFNKIREFLGNKISIARKRFEKRKKIAARKTEIGRFYGDDGETIQSAIFEIYLDADKEVNEADVQTTGKIKFFRKATRPCVFDIDKRQIYATDGTVIFAKNSGVVIDELIKCLGNAKGT